ncbi:MAG: PIG-L family deacetylase [Patescibacteria group bacterium]|nr:PIG-L family deacetylase [Patescibacteria group bacterium]
MKNKFKRLIFFSAHPDDEVAGAGGLMLKALKQGVRIKLVLCIDPAEPRFEWDEETERNRRLDEFKIVADRLKAKWSYLNFPHYPEINYTTILPCVKEIREFRPEIVIILQENDYHTEHQIVARIVKRAVWHAGRNAFPDCGRPHLVREIWESDGDRPLFDPNYFVDISDVISEKRKLFLAYGSQQKRKDLISAIEGLNRFRGIMYKKGKFAEAFKITHFFYG